LRPGGVVADQARDSLRIKTSSGRRGCWRSGVAGDRRPALEPAWPRWRDRAALPDAVVLGE
jgi:hypothetical protein